MANFWGSVRPDEKLCYFQYGNVTHTLIDSTNYHGVFLPGYKTSDWDMPILDAL